MPLPPGSNPPAAEGGNALHAAACVSPRPKGEKREHRLTSVLSFCIFGSIFRVAAQLEVHQLAGGGVRQTLHDVVVSRPLVRGQHRAVRAVVLELLDRQARVLRHDIRRHDLAAQLVRHADDRTFRDLGVVVQHGFDLRGIDILARRHDHVVATSGNRHELVFVPRADVAGVQPALVELVFRHFLVVEVAERALRRGGNDDFARRFAVVRHGFVRFGTRAVRVERHEAHVVVRARAAGGTGVVGQVERTQECVPEGLGRAVAVENVGREQLHVLLARALFERRTHGDDAAQGGQVEGGALLRAGEHGDDGRHADQEGNFVFLRVFQTGARSKIAQNDNFAAGVQRGAGAAGVDAAAVEPRGHVHRAVGRAEGEVHHDVVRGKHLVYVVDRNALGAVGRARGVQTGGFIVDMRLEIDRRVGLRLPENIVLIALPAGREGRALLRADDQLDRRAVLTQLERLARKLAELRIVDEHAGRAVVDDERDFARALTVVDRAGNRTDFVRGEVEKDKFGRVQQGKHHDIVLADAVRTERVRQTVDLAVQLAVGPAAAGLRVEHRRTVAETRNIAQKSVQIGETALERVAEHFNIIGVVVTQKYRLIFLREIDYMM